MSQPTVIKKSEARRLIPRKKVSKQFALLDTRYALIEFSVMQKNEAEQILKKRQYVEVDDGWKNGFLKVSLHEDFMVLKHDTGRKHTKGVKCFYNRDTFLGMLTYMERINQK